MEHIKAQATSYLGLWTRTPADGIGPHQQYSHYANSDLYENMCMIDAAILGLAGAVALLGGGGSSVDSGTF